MRRPTRTRGHVPERETTARREDAPCLGIESALVRDVHLDVLADHDIEGGVIERELGDVGDADLDRVAEPDSVIEPAATSQYRA